MNLWEGVEFCCFRIFVLEGLGSFLGGQVLGEEGVDRFIDQGAVVLGKVFVFFFIERAVGELPVGFCNIILCILDHDTSVFIGFGNNDVVSIFEFVQSFCFVFVEVRFGFVAGVGVACVEIVVDGLDVCLYEVVDFVRCPVGVSFGDVALAFRGFFVTKVAFENYASEVFVCVIVKIFLVWFARIWYKIQIFI